MRSPTTAFHSNLNSSNGSLFHSHGDPSLNLGFHATSRAKTCSALARPGCLVRRGLASSSGF
jgi:hypothetical protein